jgi:hypothetical protein
MKEAVIRSAGKAAEGDVAKYSANPTLAAKK